MRKENILIDPTVLACVASISVWFQGKERPRGKTEERDFSVLAAPRNKTRAKKCSPRSLTWPFFCAVFDFCSSFFAPKPHGNACYAGLNGAGFYRLNIDFLKSIKF